MLNMESKPKLIHVIAPHSEGVKDDPAVMDIVNDTLKKVTQFQIRSQYPDRKIERVEYGEIEHGIRGGLHYASMLSHVWLEPIDN